MGFLLLVSLTLLAWLTGSKVFRVLSLVVFFLYPILTKEVQFSLSWSFIIGVIRFWISETAKIFSLNL